MTEEKALAKVEYIDSTDLVSAQISAEFDIQIATAKRFPRVLSEVRERVLAIATREQKVAEECFYAIPREGKMIPGPSVRLAEIVAVSYQNLRAAARIIGTDDKFVTCQGACQDLENNVAASVEVKRRITDKNGRRYSDDMIMTTANAACAIAFRNAVFKVVPKGMLSDVYDKIKEVGMGDERTLRERVSAMLTYFEGLGVNRKDVLRTIGKRAPEDLGLTDLANLHGIAVAIKEETITAEEAFSPSKQRRVIQDEELRAEPLEAEATAAFVGVKTAPPMPEPSSEMPDEDAGGDAAEVPSQSPTAEVAPTPPASPPHPHEVFDVPAAVAELQALADEYPAETQEVVAEQYGTSLSRLLKAVEEREVSVPELVVTMVRIREHLTRNQQ